MIPAHRLAGLAAVLVVVGCDFPTEPPVWDQTWVVPMERITMGAAAFLPDAVEVSADSAVFRAQTPEAAVSLSLAEMCGAPCVLSAGLTVPKPAFSDTLATRTTLPAGVVSAVLAGGSFDAELAHNFDFDPLRPSADPTSARGHIVLRITSAGNVIAEDSIDGADRAFPASVTLTPALPVQPVTVNDTVEIEIAVYSPAGDSTTMSISDTLGVAFAPSTVEIGEITVEASGLAVDSVTTSLSFGDLDSTSVGRIQRGALRFRVQNPFAVTGSLDLTFRGGFPTVEHGMAIQEGSYEERVAFTGPEIRRILLSDSAEVVASGSASADNGTLTTTPRDAMILDAEFELVLRLGAGDSLTP